MSYRTGRSDFDDRAEYYGERRRSPSRRRTAEYDEVDVDVRVRDRSVVGSRTPAFLRDDLRRPEAGTLVLRQRDVEEVSSRPRHRSPSPSPVRYRERVVSRPRSLSPDHAHSHYHERDVERIRTVERERERVRSPSRVRVVERGRERSPSPIERLRARIVRRKSSPSPPQVVKGPTIEREVITHYRDIDHGVVKVRPPSPLPPPRSSHKDTEIDIYTSNHHTEVDIHRSRSRARSKERRSSRYYDDDVAPRDSLRVDDRRLVVTGGGSRRRARSAAPLSSPLNEEAEYITSRIDARGRPGEAYNGATRNWSIVDVPPGTERVRMDGVGGGSAEVTWQRYNGVRRSRFIPDREGGQTGGEGSGSRDRERDRVSVSVYDRDREIDIEKVTDRRVAIRQPQRRPEMWTEITKDLIVREAIEEMGFKYEETEWFFYIMEYLRHEDVQLLVKLSEDFRRHRRFHRDWDRDWDRRHRHHHHHDHHDHHHHGWDDERITEREVIIDRSPRTYIR